MSERWASRASGLNKSADDLGLTGEAKALFEEWRGQGSNWLEALSMVERAGLIPTKDEREIAEKLRAIFGLSEAEARSGAVGRDPRSASGNRFPGAIRPDWSDPGWSDPGWRDLLESSTRLEERLDDLKRTQNERDAREAREKALDARWARLHEDRD